MTGNFTAPADMTEEQAKIEVEKQMLELKAENQRLHQTLQEVPHPGCYLGKCQHLQGDICCQLQSKPSSKAVYISEYPHD